MRSALAAAVLAILTVVGAAPAAGAAPKASSLAFTRDEFAGDEAAGAAVITVRREGDVDTEASVVVTTGDETAVAGDDYTAVTATVTFAAGAEQASVEVPLVADGLDEGEETFIVTLSAPAGDDVALGNPTVAVVRVTDGEPTAFEACPPGTAPSGTFTDVDPGNVHAAAIDCVAARGVAQGTSPTTYGPGLDVNRGQVASFLRRIVDQTHVVLSEGPDRFADDEGSVHESSINALANAGILNGTSATTYEPGRPVSRAQIAAFLVRTFELVDGSVLPSSPDAFDDDDGSILEPEINAAAAAGFALGTAARTFSPGNAVRRDQAASFLDRLLDRLTVEGHVEPLA